MALSRNRFSLIFPLLLLGGTAAVVFFGFYVIDWIMSGKQGSFITNAHRRNELRFANESLKERETIAVR